MVFERYSSVYDHTTKRLREEGKVLRMYNFKLILLLLCRTCQCPQAVVLILILQFKQHYIISHSSNLLIYDSMNISREERER
jgi:hypothetical protein